MRLPEHNFDEGAEDTPQRLFEAAERLFGERGFASTSVRDITQAAGCNIAAVNYHFGSKEKLYRELFTIRLDQLREQRHAAVARVLPQAEREQDVTLVLRAFAHAFLQPLTDPQRGRWVIGMFMREMTDPRLDRRLLVEKLFRPVQAMLCDALQRSAVGLTQEQAIFAVHALIAQLLHLLQIEPLFGEQAHTQPVSMLRPSEHAIDYIVKLTEGGIARLLRDNPTAHASPAD